MNFEFESTFTNITDRRISRSGKTKRYAAMLLIANVLSASTLFSLYYSNVLIPAVYASGSNGKSWTKAFEVSAAIWCLSNICAIILLTRDHAISILRKFTTRLLLILDERSSNVVAILSQPLKYFLLGKRN